MLPRVVRFPQPRRSFLFRALSRPSCGEERIKAAALSWLLNSSHGVKPLRFCSSLRACASESLYACAVQVLARPCARSTAAAMHSVCSSDWLRNILGALELSPASNVSFATTGPNLGVCALAYGALALSSPQHGIAIARRSDDNS